MKLRMIQSIRTLEPPPPSQEGGTGEDWISLLGAWRGRAALSRGESF